MNSPNKRTLQRLFYSACLLFLFSTSSLAQESALVLKTANGELNGSILVPEGAKSFPLVLIISGSGPTDRNGNNSGMENNSLKLFAEALQVAGYASLRYDKRGVGQSDLGVSEEKELTFDNFIYDVKQWVDLLATDKRITKIIIAGHSEGSLLGMIAAQNNKKVKAFISLAGAGRPADEVIKEQLSVAPDQIKNIVFPLLDQVKKGDTIPNIPPVFYAFLRPGIQPYMTSWFKYNPQTEIKKLLIPILIVQGLTDVQVKEKDARLLAEAQPKAQLLLVTNMNHVLKECDKTDKESQKPYYEEPGYPLNKEFMQKTLEFLDPIRK